MLRTPFRSVDGERTPNHESISAHLLCQAKCSWIPDIIAFVFIFAFLLWFAVVLKDWLLSFVEPYPYASSALNGFGVMAGLFGFLRVRLLIWWRNVVLWTATVLIVVTISGFVSCQGSIISLGALVCGLATPPLFHFIIAKRRFEREHFGYLSTFLVAVATLIYHASASHNLIWGFLVVLLATGISTLAALMARSDQDSRYASEPTSKKYPLILYSGSFLLFGGLLSLACSTILPVNLPVATRTNSWQGEGFGRNTFPIYWPGNASFAPIIAQEQGVIALWVLVLLLGAAFCAGALVIWSRPSNVNNSEELGLWQARVELGCGALGALGGMLIGTRLGPPFLTIDSVGGTWALSLAVASLGIAVAPRRKLSDAARSMLQIAESSGLKKRSSLVVGNVIGLIFIVASVYWNTARGAVQPFAGNGAVAGVASYVPLEDVSLAMQDATVAMEDSHFYQHHGIDWTALHRALRVNLRQGQVRQGGSTITQQLAKNLFLSQERTLMRKIKEAALTLELERQLPKRRILEIYLNVIDYGMKQRGIEAAARYYFHTTPVKLTIAESAVLVGMVPHPPQKKLSVIDLESGREKGLERMTNLYSRKQLEHARRIPIEHLIYPFKTTWDRGATDEISAQWYGINFYYAPTTDVEAKPIYNVSPILKPPLEAFLKEAHNRFKVVGISHVGVYDDRPVHGSDKVMSSHAFGQALDIAGFHFADGSQVRVKDHSNAQVAARLLSLEALLRQYFDVVVDWRDDPKWHDNHFHAEVKGSRSLAPRDPA